MSRFGLLLVAVLALSACSTGTEDSGPVVTVYHRCGELNFDELQGWYGRLEGESGVNGRWRILFERDGDAVTAKYVANNAERYLLKGSRTGNETMTFQASSGNRKYDASITTDCRLQWDGFDGATAVPAADGLNRFVPYSELQRLDFEPCTEPLYIRSVAKTKAKQSGGSMQPPTPPTVKSDSLPVGVFGPSAEVPSGCTAAADLWVNGELEAMDMKAKSTGGDVHWYVDYEIGYIGTQHLALHRKAVCGEEDHRLLGVACTVIEVLQ